MGWLAIVHGARFRCWAIARVDQPSIPPRDAGRAPVFALSIRWHPGHNQAVRPLLELLRRKARLSNRELGEQLSVAETDVSEEIRALESDSVILGYHAVIDRERAGDTSVSAFIEVRVTPERGGGFDRLAMRIARFDQVVSCYLASGGYDLLVIVEGADLREVARFVSEKLSTLDGVLSTATHFRLKTYKENGFLFERETADERLLVAP